MRKLRGRTDMAGQTLLRAAREEGYLQTFQELLDLMRTAYAIAKLSDPDGKRIHSWNIAEALQYLSYGGVQALADTELPPYYPIGKSPYPPPDPSRGTILRARAIVAVRNGEDTTWYTDPDRFSEVFKTA